MKNTIFYTLFIFALLQSACDPCSRTNCQNGGECQNGSCYCEPGYEGNSCETEWSAKFIKGFSSVATPCKPSYSSDIRRIGPQMIEIHNLGGFAGMTGCAPSGYWVKGKLISNTYFKIEDTFCTDFAIQGDGLFNQTTNILTIHYHCDFQDATGSPKNEDCEVTYQY